MGERDLSPPPPSREPTPASARVLLALMAALALLAAVSPPSAAEPLPGLSLTTRLLRAPLGPLGPARAAAVLDALLLTAAALLASRSLRARIGGGAPTLVILAVFGSASWALVWQPDIELTPLALVVAAFALAYGAAGSRPLAEIYRPSEPVPLALARWAAVGWLIGELAPYGLLPAALVLAAAWAVPAGQRRAGLPALLGGWLLALFLEIGLRGPDALPEIGRAAADGFRLAPAAHAWNLVYFGIGRNVGLVTGFLPALLMLWLAARRSGRPMLAPAAVGLAVLAAAAQPHDFASGWVNAGFLPYYGALWLLPGREARRPEWLATAVLSALALWPLALPSAPLAADGGVSLTSARPRRWLPYESTLRALPNRGEDDFSRSGLLVRAVSGCSYLSDSRRFELVGDGPAEIWLAAPADVEMVALEFGPAAPSTFEVSGAEAGRTVFRPDGRVGVEVLLGRPRARHRLWLGDGRYAGHLISVGVPGRESDQPVRFRLLAPEL